MSTSKYQPKLALAIIVKDEWEDVERIISKYSQYFDTIHIASDTECPIKTNAIIHPYKWCDDFADKRNFLHQKCLEAKVDYYFTIDTDDEIVGAEYILEIAERAHELNVDIVYLPYNYARDENGVVDARHYKERVIKCTDHLYWNKPIHENLLPKDGYIHNIVTDDRIVINHLASHEDLQKSHDRNMKYLIDEYKRDGENTDLRTIAYLGRCYMSQQEFGKAIHFLELHVQKSGWNEDRYVSLCQLSNIHLMLKGYQMAKNCALEALDILPEWPDATACLHDIYVSQGNFKKAIYWGEETIKRKQPVTMTMVDPSRFTWRLAMSMAHAYMTEGDVEKAYRFFDRAMKLAPNVEYIKNNFKWYDQALKEKKFLDAFAMLLQFVENENSENIENLIKCIPPSMNENDIVCRIKAKYLKPKKWSENSIVILCGDALESWSPKSINTTGIGGSEESVIYLTQELVKLGWEVTVYNNCSNDEGVHDGVEYINLYKLNPRDLFNILVSWRTNVFGENVVSAKMKCVWLHDVPANGILSKWKQIDRIFVLSEYHKSLLPDDIPQHKIVVTSNGISDFMLPNVKREKYRMIYASSYDRGLENLLNRWKEIKEEVPEAELHVFYGWQNIERLISEDRMTDVWYLHMKQLLKQTGVFDHGRVNHTQLIEEFAKSRIWAYPCKFPEISCIVAMKAQAYGCYPVVTDYAALKETVKYGTIIKGSSEDSRTMTTWVANLIKVLKSDVVGTPPDHDFSWHKVSVEWNSIFKSFTKKLRIYKNYDEYKRYYLNHSPGIKDLGLINSKRISKRMGLAIDWMKKYQPKNYLDVGTFDGTLPILINEHLGIKSTGIDANINHIKSGVTYAKEKNLDVTLHGGVLLEEYRNGCLYDFITAHEIIEHVIDVDSFLSKLNSLLSDNGYISFSTPLDEGMFGKYQFNEEEEHIRTYSEQGLRDELSKYFNVLEIDNDGTILTTLCTKKGI